MPTKLIAANPSPSIAQAAADRLHRLADPAGTLEF
jgi:hypothetical protein